MAERCSLVGMMAIRRTIFYLYMILPRMLFTVTGVFALGCTLSTDPPASVQNVESAVPSVSLEDCDETQGFPGLSRPLDSLKKGKSKYFQSGDFPTGANGSDDWYGKHLRVMEEPSLIETQKTPREVYRFLWLRTFNRPVTVRLEKSANYLRLTLVELDGAGGYGPGKIVTRRSQSIDNRQWCEFVGLLEKAGYWNLKGNIPDGGLDGAQWILEGVRGGRYHFVDRWTPTDGHFREACVFLLKLAEVDTQKLGGDFY